MQTAESGSGRSPERAVAALAGDLSALCDLADEWRPYLKAVAFEVLGGNLGGKVDASDIVQGAVLAAMQRFAQFQGKTIAELQGWLVAIVRNEALQTQRYWLREQRSVEREVSIAGDSGSGRQLLDDNSTAVSRSLRRERAARLFAAIERLRAEDREVIMLRNFGGLSHAEIAQRIGRSEVAVRQLWGGALARLKKELGDEP